MHRREGQYPGPSFPVVCAAFYYSRSVEINLTPGLVVLLHTYGRTAAVYRIFRPLSPILSRYCMDKRERVMHAGRLNKGVLDHQVDRQVCTIVIISNRRELAHWLRISHLLKQKGHSAPIIGAT